MMKVGMVYNNVNKLVGKNSEMEKEFIRR